VGSRTFELIEGIQEMAGRHTNQGLSEYSIFEANAEGRG